MLCTKIGHSIQKTLNSRSDLTEWVLLHTGRAEEQKLKLEWPPGPRGWLSAARKMGGSPITSIYIDICFIEWFSYFQCYFFGNFVSEGSRFLSTSFTPPLPYNILPLRQPFTIQYVQLPLYYIVQPPCPWDTPSQPGRKLLPLQYSPTLQWRSLL